MASGRGLFEADELRLAGHQTTETALAWSLDLLRMYGPLGPWIDYGLTA